MRTLYDESAGSEPHTGGGVAHARRGSGGGARLASAVDDCLSKGRGVRPALRMVRGRSLVYLRSGRCPAAGAAASGHCGLRSVGSAGVGGPLRERSRQAICVNRRSRCQPERAPSVAGTPHSGGFPANSRGYAMTTVRLVTTFPAPAALSGPRCMPGLNFVRGSGSIQGYSASRPSDFGSRGRA